MDLATQLLRRIEDPSVSFDERAELRCRLAKELEEAGSYEAAREALGELWAGLGERPRLDGLDRRTAAEVLLRAGTLSGWIGSSNQIESGQNVAKDLISESIRIFEELGEAEKAAEALTDLAYCYWREGAFDEARVTLGEALSRLTDSGSDQRAAALLRSAIVELSAAKYHEALRILTDAAPLFEASGSHAIKGKFHMNLAIALKNLSLSEHHGDYADRALIEDAAASYHLEQAGHTRYYAHVENNLGLLLFTLSRFTEAHEHLDRARRLFASLKDTGSVAQVDETRARALLAEGHNSEAEKIVRAAVRRLESGGEPALLAEALATHGIAQARLGKHQESRLTLERAIEVAEQAGNSEGAGLAALALIEELGDRLMPGELAAVYERADRLLADSQQLETLARLRACARLCLAARQTGPQEPSAPSFIYRDQRTAELLREARAVAASEGAVLLTGETGTGKELLARLIHQWSGRRGEFVTVDCAALTAAASESQLFGPSGAVRQAAGGTLFLDEVAALGAADQSWLLRLIERGEILSDGATRIETVDVRIIAASARNLTAASSGVRSDLFYRLNALQIEIPPLRERPEDIPALAEHFIKETRAKTGKRVEFMPEAVEAMRRLPLPGNVRQLRSLIQQTVLTADTDANVTPEAVEIVALRLTQKASFADPWEGFSLDEEVLCFEGKLIRQALAEAKGSITHAARLLGITYQGLAYILQNRQRGLLPERTPAQRRRRSIIKIPYRKKKKR